MTYIKAIIKFKFHLELMYFAYVMDIANAMLGVQIITRFPCENCYYKVYAYVQQMILFCNSNDYKIINIKVELYISK